MSVSAANEGISRPQIHEWMEDSLRVIQQDLPEVEDIAERIEKLRKVIGSILQKHGPDISKDCADLTTLQRQLEGFFALEEGEMTVRDDFQVLARLRREYQKITGRIKNIFANQKAASLKAAELNKPNLLAFDTFQEIWKKKVRSQSHKIMSPKEAMERMRLGDDQDKIGEAVSKMMVGQNILKKGLDYWTFDIPHEGITSWADLRHLRERIVKIFDEMERVLKRHAEFFAKSHREAYMYAFEAIEQEARANYALPQNDTEPQKPFVWAGDFHRIVNEAFEESFVLSYSLQKKFDVFHRTDKGKQFQNEEEALKNKQRVRALNLPCKIDRETYDQYERTLEEWFAECDSLIDKSISPILGDVAEQTRKGCRRTFEKIKEEINLLFQESSTDERNSKSAHEGLNPVLDRLFLLAFMKKNAEENQVIDRDSEEIEAFHALLLKDKDRALRYGLAFSEFTAVADRLVQELPEIFDEPTFLRMIKKMRLEFRKYEREMIPFFEEGFGVEKVHESYLRSFDRLEQVMKEVFALQVTDDDSQPSVEMVTEISREEIWEELKTANARADHVVQATIKMVKEDATFSDDDFSFDVILRNAIQRLCPETVKEPRDLEDLAYWLAGRLKAIGEAMPHVPEGTSSITREFNRVQFGMALRRICMRLPTKGDAAIRFDQLLSAPAQLSSVEENNGDPEISRDDLINEIDLGLQRAEVRTIGAIGRKTVVDKRQRVLQQYFHRMRKVIKKYAHEYCPEVIRSRGPLMGLDSFISELCYCGRFWLAEAGCESDEEFDALRNKIEEGYIPALEWAETLAHSKHVNIDDFLEVDVGKIRPDASDQGQEDYRSSTLEGQPSEKFVVAIKESSLINENLLWKLVQDGYRAADKELLPQLNLQGADRELFYRYMWRFRQLGFSLAEQAAEKGPITDLDDYGKFFGVLGRLVDRLEDKYQGKLKEFLAAHFRKSRTDTENRVCHEHEQKEMQKALDNVPNPPTLLRYPDFFSNYVHQLLAAYCRDFFYSCVTPDLGKDEIQSIGIAMDTTTEILASDLCERVRGLCKTSKKGFPTLSELQQCVADFASQIDVNGLSVPKGEESRFKQEVLSQMASAIAGHSHPQELFSKVSSKPNGNGEGVLEKETNTLLEIRDEEELAALLQGARSDLQVSRNLLYSMTDLIRNIEKLEPKHVSLSALDEAIFALNKSLFREYMSSKPSESSEDDIHPRLNGLVTILRSIQNDAFNPEDVSKQRNAITALHHFQSILQGLQQSLPLAV